MWGQDMVPFDGKQLRACEKRLRGALHWRLWLSEGAGRGERSNFGREGGRHAGMYARLHTCSTLRAMAAGAMPAAALSLLASSS